MEKLKSKLNLEVLEELLGLIVTESKSTLGYRTISKWTDLPINSYQRDLHICKYPEGHKHDLLSEDVEDFSILKVSEVVEFIDYYSECVRGQIVQELNQKVLNNMFKYIMNNNENLKKE